LRIWRSDILFGVRIEEASASDKIREPDNGDSVTGWINVSGKKCSGRDGLGRCGSEKKGSLFVTIATRRSRLCTKIIKTITY
jgi:hypothetical protein